MEYAIGALIGCVATVIVQLVRMKFFAPKGDLIYDGTNDRFRLDVTRDWKKVLKKGHCWITVREEVIDLNEEP